MFDSSVYVERRKVLKEKVKNGVLLIPGNDLAPMNYPANEYPFRQDSCFLYYFGLDTEGMFGVIDIDEDTDMIFGNDFTIDDMIWMGPQPPVAEMAKRAGISKTFPKKELAEFINSAKSKGKKIHILPQYRFDKMIELEKLLGIKSFEINQNTSLDFVKAVIEQRSIKSEEEIAEIEKALEISYVMNTTAMQMTKPGMKEREVYGKLNGIANSMGAGISFPVICSVHGETLHNHHYENMMNDGDLLLIDSGAESLLHYASDTTRTFPVNGKFTEKQKEIYNVVLASHMKAIEMMTPGIRYKEVHLAASKVIASGLKDAGIMKGDMDDAVSKGAHALFFPHGLGHMMGLDVHDLEGLGENLVGYSGELDRSEQFGLDALRMGKQLKPGYVITDEPGIYFIPQLIDMWKSENKFSEFINYDKLEEYRDFGGIRIEDDILVTGNGNKVLGKKPIPKTVEDVENECNK